MKIKTHIIVSGCLGVLTIFALGASHLALTDIGHGEGDLSLEWSVLRVSFLVISGFLAATAALLPRVWKLADTTQES